jgi:hypothetical protein
MACVKFYLTTELSLVYLVATHASRPETNLVATKILPHSNIYFAKKIKHGSTIGTSDETIGIEFDPRFAWHIFLRKRK